MMIDNEDRQVLNRAQLRELIEQSHAPSVSIFMPIRSGYPEVVHNQGTLRQLIDSACAELRLQDNPSVSKTVALLEAFETDRMFWMQGGKGLAIFAAPEALQFYRLPYPLAEQVVIDKRFYIRPLVRTLNETNYYVLLLDLHGCQLLKGDGFELSQVELQDLPASLEDSLKFDEFEKQHQLHSGIGTHGASGDRHAIFHGQGDHNAVENEQIRRYLQLVSVPVEQYLKQSAAPLILYGAPDLQTTFQSICKHTTIIPSSMHGSPAHLNPAALHMPAWEAAQTQQQQDQDRLYQEARNSGSLYLSGDLSDILLAANAGRIKDVFVRSDQKQWGVFDLNAARVELHEIPQIHDEELVNLAISLTLRHGGSVYAPSAAAEGPPAPISALLRYTAQEQQRTRG